MIYATVQTALCVTNKRPHQLKELDAKETGNSLGIFGSTTQLSSHTNRLLQKKDII